MEKLDFTLSRRQNIFLITTSLGFFVRWSWHGSLGASSPRKDQVTTGKSRSPEPEESLTPVAWLRLRWVYTGSDIGPQPLPTHVTDVTTTQVSRHVSPDTCVNITRVVWVSYINSDVRIRGTGGGSTLQPALACWLSVDSLYSMSRSASSHAAPVSYSHLRTPGLPQLQFYPIFSDLEEKKLSFYVD